MKSLRQLLRRQKAQSAERSHKTRAARNGITRRLNSQMLEQRQLLAADFNDAHNYWHATDVNQDGIVSPSDALAVINYIAANAGAAQGEQVDSDLDPFDQRKVDTNNDGNVTPSDALSVINAVARGEQMDALVELFLSARDRDDNLLPEDGNGVITVGTGIENSFFLEVAYSDLRGFGDDLGIFSLYPDVGVSMGGVLMPVLREAQRVVFDEAIRDSSSGSLTIGIEGSSTTVDVPLSDIQSGFATPLRNALVNDFGYDADDFEITEPLFLRGDSGRDLGFQIVYTDESFGNVDLPDLILTANFDNQVDVTFTEFAPFEADGVTPNDAAFEFNLDIRSRTLNDNDKFYEFLNDGSFDSETGFTSIGGVGEIQLNGVRGADDNGMLIEPFDAFRFEVFLSQPVSSSNPLVVDVNPGAGVDPLTLYGDTEENVPDDLVIIDEDARVTFSTGAVINTPPTVSPVPLEATFTEDDNTDSVDLLTGASDADGDTLSVSNFSFTGGDTSGVSLNGTSIDVTPSIYNSLAVGESVVITATYDIIDGNGGSVGQTLSLTVTGVNDAPVVSGPITESRSENAPSFIIDLLQNASDVDTSDTLDAINIVQNGSDDASGITVDDTNNQITVDPSAYAALNDGESVTVTYDYQVTDGNGGTVNTTVAITINGDTPNQNPVVSGPVIETFSENDANATVDLLDGASDPDTGDVLNVADLTLVSGDASGITVGGNTLSVSPSTYNSLPEGSSETIVYSYNITDGEGGTVAQTATVTINGANDAPTVNGPLTLTATEDDNSTSLNLLDGAADPDTGDSVSVDGLTLASGDDAGINISGSSLAIDPSAYNALAAGESEVIVYTYNVIDGNGGTTAQSATITITGVNDAPTVGAPISQTFTEDDASASVDLLAGAADADTSDVLTIANFSTVSGDSSPFTIVNDNSISFAPSAYNSLAAGESEIVVVNYDVVDGNGGSAAQTATITITGVNDAPTVGNALAFTFNEDQGTQTASLLDGASDPDASDTLSVTGVSVTGDDSGVTRNGANLSIDTSAYGALNEGESAVITFTYQVTDGTASVNQTATVTIEGRDEGIPVVSGPITISFDEDDNNGTVDMLAGASDPDQDPLTVINAVVTSGDASGVTIDAANAQLLINPSAYNDLNTGETEVIVVSYDISDGNGNSVAQTATITIIGEDEPLIQPSTISGQLYIDHVENQEDVANNGATPIRNGVHDDDERTLGGVLVRLLQVTGNGEAEVASVLTNNEGEYSFTDLDPGTYIVDYNLPSSVIYTGSKRGVIVIDEAGGESESGPSLNAVGIVGVQQRIDLLAKTYLDADILDTGSDSTGTSGGSVHLNADGTQQMFIASGEFDAQYAEVVLNEARDAALLTIIDSAGEVKSARLDMDQFVVTGDGHGVRFFGTMQDFNFVQSSDDLLREEFEDYRNAIDQILSDL
ncbi:cadherin-like domain-containing protein [Roseiconus lacunae]|uniref:cadherin-like domain-containing protein n=1 Tax=Roseiconus lacunae TaxID=2605694 RepID=UPI0011F29D8E|nr:cadherin-like domain-containing protein [Roseiconus lacunae]MCD0458369.1 cadherin-like domain-containing protein [Roseiconus lacunae]